MLSIKDVKTKKLTKKQRQEKVLKSAEFLRDKLEEVNNKFTELSSALYLTGNAHLGATVSEYSGRLEQIQRSLHFHSLDLKALFKRP